MLAESLFNIRPSYSFKVPPYLIEKETVDNEECQWLRRFRQSELL